MAETYINLVNRLLRRIKEVEIDPTNFGNTHGVQSLAKDAIRSSLAHINRQEFEWPFNAVQHTEPLVTGQLEYTWPTGFKTADYNSFQIQQDNTLGVNFRALDPISRDRWYQQYRDRDFNAGSAGLGVPQFVFHSHGNGFGVTPSPDKPYTLKFRYWQDHSDLVLSDDVTRIPSVHSDVIVDGALWYMYMMRDNAESAEISYRNFAKGINDMQNVYLPRNEKLTDTRLNHRAVVGWHPSTWSPYAG